MYRKNNSEYDAGGIKWYTYLKDNVQKDGTIVKGLLSIISRKDPLRPIIAKQVKRFDGEGNTLKYAEFESVQKLGIYIFNELKSLGKDINGNNIYPSYYEIIFSNYHQKPYFDIDVKISDDIKIGLNCEDADKPLEHVLSGIKRVLPEVKETDIMVFGSHSSSKRSYHVVIDRHCFSSSEENSAFFDTVRGECPIEYKKYVDPLVYKSVQPFRMYLSCKINIDHNNYEGYVQDRPKKLENEKLSTWVSREKNDPEDSAALFMDVFRASMITHSSYCNILRTFEGMGKNIYSGESIELNDSEVDGALELFAKHLGFNSVNGSGFPFINDKVSDNMICLKRVIPSHCEFCDRIHDNIGHYLTIFKDGNVKYFCRFAPGKIIGKINLCSRVQEIKNECKLPSNSLDVNREKLKRIQNLRNIVTSEELTHTDSISCKSGENSTIVEDIQNNIELIKIIHEIKDTTIIDKTELPEKSEEIVVGKNSGVEVKEKKKTKSREERVSEMSGVFRGTRGFVVNNSMFHLTYSYHIDPDEFIKVMNERFFKLTRKYKEDNKGKCDDEIDLEKWRKFSIKHFSIVCETGSTYYNDLPHDHTHVAIEMFSPLVSYNSQIFDYTCTVNPMEDWKWKHPHIRVISNVPHWNFICSDYHRKEVDPITNFIIAKPKQPVWYEGLVECKNYTEVCAYVQRQDPEEIKRAKGYDEIRLDLQKDIN
jgi:hypothetical protein